MGPDGDLCYGIEIIAPRADCEAAAVLLSAALVPTQASLIEWEIARLWAVTISRRADEHDITLALSACVEELAAARYPADVLVATLRDLGRTNTFRPALAEMVAALDKAVSWRRGLYEALRYAREPEPPDQPAGPPPTDEEIDAIYAKWGVPRDLRRHPRRVRDDEKPLAQIYAEMKTAPPAIETDPGVREMVEAWNRELGISG